MDRLLSIVAKGFLWCDALIVQRHVAGTTIGMLEIKQRRLGLLLTSHPELHVGDCVPFYFCPRSVMLFLLHRTSHPDLTYQGGQDPIVHLEADFYASIKWAQENKKRWAFTSSNAGSYYFDDYCDLNDLNEINWDAVQVTRWRDCKEEKQAEFLLEQKFPWDLVERIGVYSLEIYQQATSALLANPHRPKVEILKEWYY